MSGCMAWRHMQIVVTATIVSNPNFFTGCGGGRYTIWGQGSSSKAATAKALDHDRLDATAIHCMNSLSQRWRKGCTRSPLCMHQHLRPAPIISMTKMAANDSFKTAGQISSHSCSWYLKASGWAVSSRPILNWAIQASPCGAWKWCWASHAAQRADSPQVRHYVQKRVQASLAWLVGSNTDKMTWGLLSANARSGTDLPSRTGPYSRSTDSTKMDKEVCSDSPHDLLIVLFVWCIVVCLSTYCLYKI